VLPLLHLQLDFKCPHLLRMEYLSCLLPHPLFLIFQDLLHHLELINLSRIKTWKQEMIYMKEITFSRLTIGGKK
jgi:hypothetical protein